MLFYITVLYSVKTQLHARTAVSKRQYFGEVKSFEKNMNLIEILSKPLKVVVGLP